MMLVKIAERGNGMGITIPRAYLRQLGWTRGEYVSVEIVEGALAVNVVRNIGRTLVHPPERDRGGLHESV